MRIKKIQLSIKKGGEGFNKMVGVDLTIMPLEARVPGKHSPDPHTSPPPENYTRRFRAWRSTSSLQG